MSVKCTVVIQKENDWYVAKSLENSVASQGKTIDEATANLQEAIILYYKDNDAKISYSPVFVTTLEVVL